MSSATGFAGHYERGLVVAADVDHAVLAVGHSVDPDHLTVRPEARSLQPQRADAGPLVGVRLDQRLHPELLVTVLGQCIPHDGRQRVCPVAFLQLTCGLRVAAPQRVDAPLVVQPHGVVAGGQRVEADHLARVFQHQQRGNAENAVLGVHHRHGLVEVAAGQGVADPLGDIVQPHAHAEQLGNGRVRRGHLEPRLRLGRHVRHHAGRHHTQRIGGRAVDHLGPVALTRLVVLVTVEAAAGRVDVLRRLAPQRGPVILGLLQRGLAAAAVRLQLRDVHYAPNAVLTEAVGVAELVSPARMVDLLP